MKKAILAIFAVPSLLFFVWVALNCALPWIPLQLGWPWLILEYDTGLRMAFDALLYGSFLVLHSVLARESIQAKLRLSRTGYLIIAGAHAFLVMAYWQNTGVVVYSLIRPPLVSLLVSLFLYVAFMGLAAQAASEVGLDDLLAGKDGQSPLQVRGWYARMRHPIYFFTAFAWIVTPVMTLDRVLLIALSGVYLAISVPLEERKLRASFGEAYGDYQRRTPSFFPRF